MKKVIVTLCSLALSLAGTFGVNQLSSRDDANINTNQEMVSVDNDVEDAEEQKALPADETTTEVQKEEKKETSDLKEAAPVKKADGEKADNDTEVDENMETKIQADQYEKTEAKATNKANTNKVKAPANDTAKPAAVNNTAKPAVNNTAQKTYTNNNTAQKPAADNLGSFKTNGGNVYVYKNIDLSNCDSTRDVVNELQKNGFKNINMNNIQDISSLEDILDMIGKKDATDNTAKPAPVTKPSNPTPTAPAPTKPAEQKPAAKPSTPSNNTGVSSYASEVLRLVNAERAKAGLPAFSTNSTLTAAANKRAQETEQSFSHTRPNGTSFSTVLKEYGVSYRTAGENIAYGQRSPQEVVNGWMNSPGHRANILNNSFNKIGIGVHQSNGVIYWSQLFTN